MESLSLMTNINHVEKNIVQYKNLIEDPSAFIKMIEDTEFILDENPQIYKWTDWYSSNADGLLFGKKKNARFSSPQSDTTIGLKAHLVTKKIKDIVTQCALDYQNRTGIEVGFLPDHFNINKYDEFAYMGPHVDYEGEGKTDFYPTISMVFYLNDNYTGGDLNFPEQDVLIKPEAGSLVVFPSHKPYYHDPRPVESGIKYMVPLFWFDN
jgi:hypothetical protein